METLKNKVIKANLMFVDAHIKYGNLNTERVGGQGEDEGAVQARGGVRGVREEVRA